MPKKHTHQWRKAKGQIPKGRGVSMVVQCTSCKNVEWLNADAAREFQRQIALGVEPYFVSDGLVPVVIIQSDSEISENEET